MFWPNEDPYEVPAFPNEDVYLYVKHIDNSRVLREADPAARKICWRLIGSSFAFAVVVIALLLPSAESSDGGLQDGSLARRSASVWSWTAPRSSSQKPSC